MQNKALFTRDQKYQVALFGILAISSLISIGLFMARTAPSPHGPYTSLILNLILAWIPVGFAWAVYKFVHSQKMLVRVATGLCAFLWLLFFPNSFYILTDFQHIALMDTNTPVWYDVLMLLWFSWIGVFLGAVSLYLMQIAVTCRLGMIGGWVFTAVAIVLASVGVYIGRFVGVNSLDLLTYPVYTFSILREHISYPPYRSQTITYSLLFSLFLLFIYLMLFILGQLIKGQSHSK